MEANMLKKLNISEMSVEQNEFNERVANGCAVACRSGCNSPDTFVVVFEDEVV